MHYVYILASSRTSKTYTGYSNDPQRRLEEHNSADNEGWTRQFKPWRIDAYVACKNEETAQIVEAYFKNASGKEKFDNFAASHPMHPHPKQGFFDALQEGRAFGSARGNGRFKVKKVNGQTVFERVRS